MSIPFPERNYQVVLSGFHIFSGDLNGMTKIIATIRQCVKIIPGAHQAYLKYHYGKYLKELRKQDPVGKGLRVLVINHHFDQDIEALLNGCGGHASFFVVKCMPFFNQALLYFQTDAERDGIIPYPALPSKVKNAYRDLCRSLFKDLQEIFPFELVVMPSDSFWWIREFLEVVKENGVKRIVLDKEGTISPYYFEVHSKEIQEKFPFMSDYLLVWSDRQKRYWMKSGAPEKAIKIVGQPRSDFFFHPERWMSREDLGLGDYKKVVLFFTFDVNAYIHIFPAEEVKREGYSWLTLRNDLNSALRDFASRNPDVCVLVKVHPQQSDIEFMRRFVKESNLPNLKLAEGASLSSQLIVNADLIIGFQTTALIEAMLTEKPIFYAAWGATEQKLRKELIPFHETSGLERIASPAELIEKILAWRNGARVGGAVSQRKSFTDSYFNADGKVCKRISAEFLEIAGGRH